jgi:MoaA/NifB/PqqE/SkfB family radical SAM enzyme
MKTKFNLLKNIFLSNFKKLAYPYKITFALTYRCNLRCKICQIWKTPYRKELQTYEIEKIFKNFRSLSWLDLTGGEITLREDLTDIVDILLKNSKNLLILRISTNGQLPEKIFNITKKISESDKFPVINVSIDGPKRINDKLRGIAGSYEKSLETFKLLRTVKSGHFHISCTISEYNLDYIDELIEGLRSDISDFSLSDLHFNIFHNSSHYYRNDNVDGLSKIRFSDIKKYLDLSKNGTFIKRFLESVYIKNLEKYLEKNRPPLPCQALNSSCFINPYGEAYPCVSYDKSIGNLKDFNYNLNRLWEIQEASTVRKYIIEKKCPGGWTPCEAYLAILGAVGRNMRMGAKF